MSQPESEFRLAWLVTTLGGLPQTKEIIDLSEKVGASQIALTANEPPSPKQPTTLDEDAWELYKERSLARIERQRRKRVEEAELQDREEQVKSLSEIWSQFLKVSTQHESPRDTPLQMHRAEWQREEHVLGYGQQQEGGEHAEVEEERGGSSSASYVPTTKVSSLPEMNHPPEGKGPGFMTFVDIWNHGNPRDKIIEPEPGAGEYYVICCRRGECSLSGRHFGPDPYRGARAHLRHAHSKELGADYRLSNGNILRTLGIHVKGCDTARAKESNAIFVDWYNNPASTTKGVDESIPTQPYSQSLRRRRRRSIPVAQRSAAPHKGRRKRLPPDEIKQPSASVSKRAKRGKKAEKVEAGTAIPKPSSATSHDLPELADQAPAGISLESLDAIQQETNATQDEELHGQPDANREAQARVRGEDASASGFGYPAFLRY